MNLPNKLTMSRLILVPAFMAVMLMGYYLPALAIFCVAAITDFFDGYLARKNNLITTFGKLCDPVADKILTTAALLAFMQLGLCDIWVVMSVLAREFLVTSFRLVASAQGVVIPAGVLGKIKTICQMTFSILIMLGLFIGEFVSFDFEKFALVSNILFWITAVLTVVSGIKYIIDGKKVIDFSK